MNASIFLFEKINTEEFGFGNPERFHLLLKI